MRSIRATHDLVAVSANAKETAINTEQTLDTSLLVELNTALNLEPRREDNADELTGKEEADTIYDMGSVSGGSLNFPKAQPQHFAFLAAFGLGDVATVAAGTGYQHTITPKDGDEDSSRSLPSFTAAQRFGKTVAKRRFASFFVDALSAVFAKDDWVKINGTCKGTGKVTDNVTQEDVTAPGNSTEIALAANNVEGSTAQELLDSVHSVKAQLASNAGTGIWHDVSVSLVSNASPANLHITAPGVTVSNATFRILYVPTESGWMSFPSRVTETPLRVAQMTMKVDSAWNGSSFVGGRTMDAEINSVEWGLNNNLAVEFVPGAGGSYASKTFREGRQQTLKLNREFRDFILQQHISDNDTFGLYLLAEGAVYDSPHKYQVEIIFPKVGVIAAPVSVNGKRLAEAGDLRVLEDDTYGSVIVKVKNLVSGYAG